MHDYPTFSDVMVLAIGVYSIVVVWRWAKGMMIKKQSPAVTISFEGRKL